MARAHLANPFDEPVEKHFGKRRRQAPREEQRVGLGSHGGQVAHRGLDGAGGQLGVGEPASLEVHALDGGVDGEHLRSRVMQHRRVVADAEVRRPKLAEARAEPRDGIEFVHAPRPVRRSHGTTKTTASSTAMKPKDASCEA